MLQAFGYNLNGASLVHDTKEVLAEMSRQELPPDSSTEEGRLVIATIFRDAREKRGGYKGGYPRLDADVQHYIKTGILPYDVIRTWFALRYGEEAISIHIARGSNTHAA